MGIDLMVSSHSVIVGFRVFMWCLVVLAVFFLLVIWQISVALQPLDNALIGLCAPYIRPQAVSIGVFYIALNPLNWGATLRNAVNATYGNLTHNVLTVVGCNQGVQTLPKGIGIGSIGTSTVPT